MRRMNDAYTILGISLSMPVSPEIEVRIIPAFPSSSSSPLLISSFFIVITACRFVSHRVVVAVNFILLFQSLQLFSSWLLMIFSDGMWLGNYYSGTS